MSKSEIYLSSTKEEQKFYDDVRHILQTARNSAYKSVNSIMSKAYWEIGERIVQQEQRGAGRAKYGDYIIRNLSKELSGEFGTGFSVANLKNCRQFYRTFPKDSIGYTACSQLSWSHLRSIMRLDSEKERNYYIQEAIKGSWSVKLLERNIKSGFYRKCFVIIDLKTDKLTHQDIGQMDMYVRMFDDLKRAQDDNPTIGIILCTDKDETIVKYSVLNDSRQIFASKYMTVLPTEEELAYELGKNQNMLLDNIRQTKE